MSTDDLTIDEYLLYLKGVKESAGTFPCTWESPTYKSEHGTARMTLIFNFDGTPEIYIGKCLPDGWKVEVEDIVCLHGIDLNAECVPVSVPTPAREEDSVQI
jgi:hypothetical protein